MSETRILTSLRNAAREPLSAEELKALKSRAWLEQGLAVVRPDEIGDDWLRQALVNFLSKLYGKRFKK